MASFLYNQLESFVLARVNNENIPTELETHYFINENNESDCKNHILLFVHGFPDNHTLWKKQTDFFSENGYICITITLPNYNVNNITNKYGYDWDIVASLIAKEIEKIVVKYEFHNITLVMHDFGTMYGYMAYQILNDKKNNNCIKSLVFIDVGDGLDGSTSKTQQILFLCYHWYLILIFLIPNFIAKWFLIALCYFPGAPLCSNYRTFSQISNSMCYPYFHLWRRRLQIGGNHINCNSLTMWEIPKNIPIFFGFGEQFSIRFHTKRWREYLLRNSNICKYIAYQCGHWVMVDQHDKFNHDLLKWLKKINT